MVGRDLDRAPPRARGGSCRAPHRRARTGRARPARLRLRHDRAAGAGDAAEVAVEPPAPSRPTLPTFEELLAAAAAPAPDAFEDAPAPDRGAHAPGVRAAGAEELRRAHGRGRPRGRRPGARAGADVRTPPRCRRPRPPSRSRPSSIPSRRSPAAVRHARGPLPSAGRRAGRPRRSPRRLPHPGARCRGRRAAAVHAAARRRADSGGHRTAAAARTPRAGFVLPSALARARTRDALPRRPPTPPRRAQSRRRATPTPVETPAPAPRAAHVPAPVGYTASADVARRQPLPRGASQARTRGSRGAEPVRRGARPLSDDRRRLAPVGLVAEPARLAGHAPPGAGVAFGSAAAPRRRYRPVLRAGGPQQDRLDRARQRRARARPRRLLPVLRPHRSVAGAARDRRRRAGHRRRRALPQGAQRARGRDRRASCSVPRRPRDHGHRSWSRGRCSPTTWSTADAIEQDVVGHANADTASTSCAPTAPTSCRHESRARSSTAPPTTPMAPPTRSMSTVEPTATSAGRWHTRTTRDVARDARR